jgi:hypothetical protein
MTRFGDVLRATSERLNLPQPAKSRILLEVAADMEDLYEFHLAGGASAEAARRRAIEQCDLSDAALAELVRVHTSGLRSFLDQLGERTRSRWERAALIALVLFLAMVGGRQLLFADLIAGAGRFVFPVVLLTLAAIVLFVRKVYVLHVRKDHDVRRLRAGLSPLLALGATNLLVGGYGYWIELYVALTTASPTTESALAILTGWLFRGSALLIVTFLAAILCALLWFVLANSIARIEQADAALLLQT